MLGANSVTGIPLGDGCIVDAGIAVLEGTKIAINNQEASKIAQVNENFTPKDGEMAYYKGLELAGLNGVHFRQDSTTGQILAKRSQREVVLNSELH